MEWRLNSMLFECATHKVYHFMESATWVSITRSGNFAWWRYNLVMFPRTKGSPDWVINLELFVNIYTFGIWVNATLYCPSICLKIHFLFFWQLLTSMVACMTSLIKNMFNKILKRDTHFTFQQIPETETQQSERNSWRSNSPRYVQIRASTIFLEGLKNTAPISHDILPTKV